MADIWADKYDDCPCQYRSDGTIGHERLIDIHGVQFGGEYACYTDIYCRAIDKECSERDCPFVYFINKGLLAVGVPGDD